jgi:hypothetical protein
VSPWTLLSPEGETPKEAFETAGRGGDFNGKTIGLFWNGKPGGSVFLEEVGRQLKQRYQGASIRKIWEERPGTVTSYGNTPENLAYMAQSADLVIAASSD